MATMAATRGNTGNMTTLQDALVNDLCSLASISPDDDGVETARHYVQNLYDPAKSYQENLEYIGDRISEDQ